MALNAAKGNLFYVTVASTGTTAGPLTSNTWYLIQDKAASGSALPANLTTGYIFKQITNALPVSTTAPMTSDDEVRALTLTSAAFVTNMTGASAVEKFDETVRTDSVKSYQVSSKPEKSGTINGYLIDNDSAQTSIWNRIDELITQSTAGAVTKTAPTASVARFLLKRNSTDNAVDLYEYIPSVIDNVQTDFPMEGPQTFSFNWTAKGADRPAIYKIDK